MSGAMDDAYRALGDTIAEALVAAGFLSAIEKLEIDPEGDWEPDGEDTEVQTGASLIRLQTRPVRQIFGGGRTHYVVERDVSLSVGAAGTVPAGDPTHEQRVGELLPLLAAIPADDPTLGGACERVEMTAADDDLLPSDGIRKTLTFTIRVRSGDPLGMTTL